MLVTITFCPILAFLSTMALLIRLFAPIPIRISVFFSFPFLLASTSICRHINVSWSQLLSVACDPRNHVYLIDVRTNDDWIFYKHIICDSCSHPHHWSSDDTFLFHQPQNHIQQEDMSFWSTQWLLGFEEGFCKITLRMQPSPMILSVITASPIELGGKHRGIV